MKEYQVRPFCTVYLRRRARFCDGIRVPERHLGRPLRVLSCGKKSALIEHVGHVEYAFLRRA